MGERLSTLRLFFSLSDRDSVVVLRFWFVSTNSQGLATDLAGKPFDPFRAAPGKVVVLIFVRTDCPVSNRYAPTIKDSAQSAWTKPLFWCIRAAKELQKQFRRHGKTFHYTFCRHSRPSTYSGKQSAAQVTPKRPSSMQPDNWFITGASTISTRILATHAERDTHTNLPMPSKRAVAGKTLTASASPAVGCYISDLE